MIFDIYEGTAMQLLHCFMKKLAAAALNSHIKLRQSGIDANRREN